MAPMGRVPRRQRLLALAGSSREIALSFLTLSESRAQPSVLRPLCTDQRVTSSALGNQATSLYARLARYQRSRSSGTAPFNHSRKATNVQQQNSRKRTVPCRQRFNSNPSPIQIRNSPLGLDAPTVSLHQVGCPLTSTVPVFLIFHILRERRKYTGRGDTYGADNRDSTNREGSFTFSFR